MMILSRPMQLASILAWIWGRWLFLINRKTTSPHEVNTIAKLPIIPCRMINCISNATLRKQLQNPDWICTIKSIWMLNVGCLILHHGGTSYLHHAKWQIFLHYLYFDAMLMTIKYGRCLQNDNYFFLLVSSSSMWCSWQFKYGCCLVSCCVL